MTRKRMAVARLWFEGNAFCPLPADQAAFDAYEWHSGPDVLRTMRGTATELGAVAAFADARPDWEVVVLRCAAALPAGPIDEDVFDRLCTDVLTGLQAGEAQGGWDAVYLSLHGAAISARRHTPELDLARLIRARLPQVPMGASFDLHGNMPSEWADVLDIASVYRTHPHVDMADTAARVLQGLVQCAERTLRTRAVLLNEGVILPSINMRTAAGPMAELEAAARAATTGALLEVGVFGGFPYADTPATGASVYAISDAAQDPEGAQAHAAARQVMARIHALAPQFHIALPNAANALTLALAQVDASPGDATPVPSDRDTAPSAPSRLVAVTDSGDNPLSGGAGDTPALFSAMLAAAPQVATVFASFADPDVVRQAQRAGVGGAIRITLGARHGERFGRAVPLAAHVACLTDGRFQNTGPMQTGVWRACGASTLLKIDALPDAHVIVTERVVACDDPAFYALHGIDLDRLRLLCVKAKNHFRAAFASRCAAIIDCDAPGPACQDLSQLPLRHAHVLASVQAVSSRATGRDADPDRPHRARSAPSDV